MEPSDFPSDSAAEIGGWVGIRLAPQCLHFFASMKTNSRQSGQRTCVSGVGPKGSRFSDGIRPTAINAKKLKKNPKMNQPKPDLPLLDATTAVRIAQANQITAISTLPPFFIGLLAN